MIFTFNERYDFYTNNLFSNGFNYHFLVPKKFTNKMQNEPYYTFCPNEIWPEIKNNNKGCIIVTDDGYENYGLPAFQKTRPIANHSEWSIIHKLQAERHWGPFYSLKDNIPWENKKNEIIWRGTPTGNGERTRFCDLYREKYDVGITCVWDHARQYEHLIKPEISYDTFVQYKYIISIEGNEKDSGSNWKLGSGSLVIMKPPKYESWLMESKLIPWVHYVPLNDEMNNLDEIYNWCLNNDDKCKEIVKNANAFMHNFRDMEMENNLIRKIENDYFNYIELNVEE
jgi:hypothetical protein